jgi:thiol:disulfide interchange protein
MTGDVRKMLMKYGVLSLPTVLFLDPDGRIYQELTLTGFLPADEFAELLYKASARPEKC